MPPAMICTSTTTKNSAHRTSVFTYPSACRYSPRPINSRINPPTRGPMKPYSCFSCFSFFSCFSDFSSVFSCRWYVVGCVQAPVEGCWVLRAAPHFGQKVISSSILFPHFGQYDIKSTFAYSNLSKLDYLKSFLFLI